MPNYFNKSGNSTNRENKSIDQRAAELDDPEVVKEIASKEMKKNLVKIYKVTTNKTRLEIAEAIHEELGETISTSYIDQLWGEIREEEEFKIADKADQEIQKQYMEYTVMKHELWKAWHGSKEDAEEERTEFGETPKGRVDKTITKIAGRNPDYRYLDMIDRVNDSIRELLGLKKHLEFNFNQQNNQFNVIGSGAPALVPQDHDVFTKKPEDLPETAYTSIEDEDPDDVVEGID